MGQRRLNSFEIFGVKRDSLTSKCHSDCARNLRYSISLYLRPAEVSCSCFGSYAANRYASAAPLLEPKTVVLQACLSHGGRARPPARRNLEYARSPEIRSDGSRDDGRTHDTAYSEKFRTK